MSTVFRTKLAQKMLNAALRSACVAEKVCQVDRSDSYYIACPYITGATAAIATMAGTYAVSTVTTTDDNLTITDQVTYGVHLYEFERTLSQIDLFTSFVDDMSAAVAVAADKFVLNKVLDGATTTMDTPSGGFAYGNIQKIIADLSGKVAGYHDAYKGLFIVIENTELSGFIQAGMQSGFNFSDAVLNNGFAGRFGGVDVYVIRTGTFVTATVGTLTATNADHRLGGVKGIATYAAPRGIQYAEKDVTLKTGKEIAVWANIGAKVWTPKAALLVDIAIV